MEDDYTLQVEVYDGKYTVVQDKAGNVKAFRYGVLWRDCCGDGLILALAQEVRSLREELSLIANTQ